METALKEPIITKIADTPTANLPALVQAGECDLQTWSTLKDVIWPGATNDKIIETAFRYCKARGLDPLKKVVHIVKYGTKEVILPGIAEVRTTAARTGLYAGKDSPVFGPAKTESFEGIKKIWNNSFAGDKSFKTEKVQIDLIYPEWVEQTVYKLVGNTRCPFIERVFWKEAYATISADQDVPNTMWQERPFGQLAKCGEAASLRCAFPEELGSIHTAEELEGRRDITEIVGTTVAQAKTDPVMDRLNQEKEAKEPKVTDVEIAEGTITTIEEVARERADALLKEIVGEIDPHQALYQSLTAAAKEAEKLDTFDLSTFRLKAFGVTGRKHFTTLQEAQENLVLKMKAQPSMASRQALIAENHALVRALDEAELSDLANALYKLKQEGN